MSEKTPKGNMTSNNAKTQWNFRPSALHRDYANASQYSLMKNYLQDASRASKNGGLTIPPKPINTNGAIYLRTCQWNIHYLDANWLGYRKPWEHVTAVGDAILDVDADVIILNEFHLGGIDKGGAALSAHLKREGHVILQAPCFCPTAVATRLPVVSSDRFRLDSDRAAVSITVNVQDAQEIGAENATNAQVTIYGTHLECSDDREGSYRLDEAKTLLERIAKDKSSNPNESILVAGDFNQQRCCDYTPNEWKAICANKAKRESPTDDGVSKAMQDAGFACCYDQKNLDKNWEGDHPPSTHWSGTTIDYSYSRGRHMTLVGVYVLPHNLSDHRMVVCDWKINTTWDQEKSKKQSNSKQNR